MVDGTRQVRRRRSILIASAALAVLLPMAARVIAGPNGAFIHVRWRADVDDATRQRLETRFTLTRAERLEGTTWRYDLIDASSENLRALVSESAAEDTHHINRRNGSIGASAVRTPRRNGLVASGDTLVWTADLIAAALALWAVFMLTGAKTILVNTQRMVGFFATALITRRAIRLLTRGIPQTTARVAGTFRIVFGTAVVWFFLSHPEGAITLDAAFNPLIEGQLHARVVDWMRAHPSVTDALIPWLLTTGVAFTVGAFTRFTYPLFVAGAIAWLFVATTHDSTHPHSTLGLALVALLPSRWGDALSVDAWRRRATHERAATAAGQAYGYSTWAPTVVFGIAFAAAAWAKLSHTPGWGDWILNGSVKYHFITDAHNAPVDWGPQLAGHPSLAVLASLAAVATESLVITAAFSRSEWYRLSMGVAAMGLLAGFWLFMGVFWPGWWILLLGFLPWHRMLRADASERVVATASMRLPPWTQIAAVLTLVGQQIAFSTLRIERSPMFTYYPMYSSTFASSDEFDAAMVPYYRIVVSTAEGNVELSCDAPESLVEEFRTALQGSTDASARVWRAVHGCDRNLPAVKQVVLEGDRHVFDWQELKFRTTRAAVVLGPIAAQAVTTGSARD